MPLTNTNYKEMTQMEKLAFAAGLKMFGKGLMQPFKMVKGTGQRIGGAAQQGWGAVTNNKELVNKGVQTFTKGTKTRANAGLMSGLGLNKSHVIPEASSKAFKAGRGVGALTAGSALFSAPYTAAEYMGAANVDPEAVKGHALAAGRDRVQQRLQEFQAMPFMQRMQAAWNPEEYSTNNVLGQSQEYYDLNEGLASGQGQSNPGLMRYLKGFLPFVGGDPIQDAVRYQTAQHIKGASEMDKEATQLAAHAGNIGKVGLGKAWNYVKGVLPNMAGVKQLARQPRKTISTNIGNPLAGVKDNWNMGRLHSGSTPFNALNRESRIMGPHKPTTAMQDVMGRLAYGAGKAGPLKLLGGTALTGVGAAYLPMSYGDGKRKVYDTAAQDAMGVADAQYASQFANANPFMRMGGAAMPGMMNDYVMRQVAELNNMSLRKNKEQQQVQQ